MQIIPNMDNSPIICNNLLECFCNEQRTPPIIPNVSVNPIKEKRGQYLSDLFCVITFTTFGLVL
jgi:hypothetical protein